MATRENFLILLNGEALQTRHKWNAANRAIEQYVGELAKAEGKDYRLADSHSEKVGFYHVSGFRVWEREDGLALRFEVEKVG